MHCALRAEEPRRHARDVTASADPRHRRFPSRREPSRERTKGSGGKEQRGNSTKEACRPTRTKKATDRPRDAKKRRDAKILFPGIRKPRGPARAHDPRPRRPGREIDPPSTLDRQTQWNTHTDDRQNFLVTLRLSSPLELAGVSQFGLCRRLRRRPRRQPVVSAAASACRPLQRRPKSSPGKSRPPARPRRTV